MNGPIDDGLPSIYRDALLVEATAWIGTPYCHQACTRQVGADCLGLVLGVWETVTGRAINLKRHDQRFWAQHADGEPLLDGLRTYLQPIGIQNANPGDVLALRWRQAWPASHLALLAADQTIIHAYEGGAVVRSHLKPWLGYVAAAFRFPNLLETGA